MLLLLISLIIIIIIFYYYIFSTSGEILDKWQKDKKILNLLNNSILEDFVIISFNENILNENSLAFKLLIEYNKNILKKKLPKISIKYALLDFYKLKNQKKLDDDYKIYKKNIEAKY